MIFLILKYKKYRYDPTPNLKKKVLVYVDNERYISNFIYKVMNIPRCSKQCGIQLYFSDFKDLTNLLQFQEFGLCRRNRWVYQQKIASLMDVFNELDSSEILLLEDCNKGGLWLQESKSPLEFINCLS